eukprot:2217748-Pyramimonas_sp.AAC.1
MRSRGVTCGSALLCARTGWTWSGGGASPPGRGASLSVRLLTATAARCTHPRCSAGVRRGASFSRRSGIGALVRLLAALRLGRVGLLCSDPVEKPDGRGPSIKRTSDKKSGHFFSGSFYAWTPSGPRSPVVSLRPDPSIQ